MMNTFFISPCELKVQALQAKKSTGLRTGQVVDLLLVGLHARHILLQANLHIAQTSLTFLLLVLRLARTATSKQVC